MPTETELKLALAPAAAAALLRHPALRAARRGRTHTVQLTGVYFDTARGLLASEGVALRVRQVGRRWVQTIKGPPGPGAGAGLAERAEHEWPLPGPSPDATRLSATPWRKLASRAAKQGGLVRTFTTDVRRRSVPLRFPDGTLAVLCIDHGEIRAVRDGRTHRVPVAEVEIELESGAASNLYRLALALSADLPLGVMTAGKAERGLALLRGERDLVAAPVKARSVALGRGVATADALSALVRECLDQVAANAPGLLADDDPEWVHQMRIGTRRLRSCLALVASCAPSPALRLIREEARWLAGVLGSARDWDVFTHETLPPIAAWFARDPATAGGLRRMRARALTQSRATRSAARDAVASRRFHRLLLAGGLLCATPRFGAPVSTLRGEPGDALLQPAADFARRLLALRHRKLHRCATALHRGSTEERHAARIAAKRLRYVAEFFAPLFARRRVKAYLKGLTELQDVLGQLNDAAAALDIAGGSGGPAGATGALRGWVAAQAAALEPGLVETWRRYAKSRPFWTRGK